MAETNGRAKPTAFKLVRMVNGKRQEPGEVDVDRAIDDSSSRATLEDLGRRGHSTVRILDREKIAGLVRQAVREATAARTESLLEDERRKIEKESLERFGELLDEHKQVTSAPREDEEPQDTQEAAGPAAHPPRRSAPAPGVMGVDELVGTISETIRTELTASDGGWLDDVDRRIERLTDGLERAEKALAKLKALRATPNHARGEDAAREPSAEQQELILEKIFEENLQLRGTATSPEN